MAEQGNQNAKNGQKEPDIHQLLKVRREKLAELQENGRDPFLITKYDQDVHSADIKNNYAEYEGKDVSIAGRMMSKRVMGKASFCNVQDLKGDIQCYVARDEVGEDSYKEFKKFDIGDIVGVKGKVFTTKMGEISVHVTSITLLSKSLQILPEKFHGLTNTDMRYRQRYVDLIMNTDVKETFIKRSKILAAIRKYLAGENFMEVETPMLVSNAGGAAARPFETHFNALDEDLKLRISLELYLKRLIVGGMERVYEIGRVFRNEGLDTRHNPEFTLMELYQAYTDYHGMMDLTENLYRFVAQEVLGTTKIVYNGIEMDLGQPFVRMTMVDAVKKYAGVDFNEIHTLEEAKAAAKEHKIEVEKHHKKGDILNLFFEEYVEEHLVQPTFIMDHPLIQHKISMLRNKNTGTNEFRKLIEEIGILMGYEALRDLPLEDVEIETPIETCKTPMISGKKLAIVPILRAGLGMVNGILALVPSAKVGHIGLYRDEETHEPHEYYCKLPDPIDQRLIVVLDPMLATGGSAIAAINFIKEHGGKNIKCMFVIAAPEGLERLHREHPDVQIYVGHLDRELNDRAYICPGLGDAGDRIFGTV